MEELIELGELTTALGYALKESVLAVIEPLLEALFPEPTELLLHALTVTKGPDASLASRFYLPRGNYLYAEQAIVETYRRRGSKLPISTVEGLGLAYIRGMAPTLKRMLSASMVNLDVARRAEGRSAVGGVSRLVDQEECHTWSGRSKRAVVAAVALSRIDAEVDSHRVRELLVEVPDAMDDCPERRATIAELTWVLFDSGAAGIDDLLPLLEGDLGTLPDLATTLLKRGQCRDISELVRDFGDVYFAQDGFCYWPLLDYLDREGIVDCQAYGRHPSQPLYAYLRARRMNLKPPPWWDWLGGETS